MPEIPHGRTLNLLTVLCNIVEGKLILHFNEIDPAKEMLVNEKVKKKHLSLKSMGH